MAGEVTARLLTAAIGAVAQRDSTTLKRIPLRAEKTTIGSPPTSSQQWRGHGTVIVAPAATLIARNLVTCSERWRGRGAVDYHAHSNYS